MYSERQRDMKNIMLGVLLAILANAIYDMFQNLYPYTDAPFVNMKLLWAATGTIIIFMVCWWLIKPKTAKTTV